MKDLRKGENPKQWNIIKKRKNGEGKKRKTLKKRIEKEEYSVN